MTDRLHAFEAIDNFRDYGDYATAAGRRLHKGRLYRSAHHANATDAEIAAIAALARAVEDNHATGDKVEVFDIDMRMHRAIVAAGHNAALSRSYGEYLARLWRIRFLSARRRSDAAQVLAAHRGMVDALAARDWPAMRAHMESHLDGLVRNLDAHFSDDDAEA